MTFPTRATSGETRSHGPSPRGPRPSARWTGGESAPNAGEPPSDEEGPRSVPREGSAARRRVLGALIGHSPAMQSLADQVERVLATDVAVAIFGESGTGKELVARAIHDGGSRSRGPFVAINCGAIPPSLQESELFGHERGAFTGATQTRRGCFELARGGTLFLDELGEMSPSAQAALLRTLQEKTVRRVGGSAEVPVDVRIVCATRRDLKAEVAAGRFREDLYFRLVVYPIELPPLRSRREDVALLAEHALGRLQAEGAVRVRGVAPGALDALARYPWPGNVRELLNVMQRALLTCAGEEITRDDLPADIRFHPGAAAEPAGSPSGEEALLVSLCCDGDRVLPLEQIERFAIQRALGIADGNVRRAAAMLGIGRATLYRRLSTLRIPFEQPG